MYATLKDSNTLSFRLTRDSGLESKSKDFCYFEINFHS